MPILHVVFYAFVNCFCHAITSFSLQSTKAGFVVPSRGGGRPKKRNQLSNGTEEVDRFVNAVRSLG